MNTTANIYWVTETDGHTHDSEIFLDAKEHDGPFTYEEVAQDIRNAGGIDLDLRDLIVIYASFVDEEGALHRNRFDIEGR